STVGFGKTFARAIRLNAIAFMHRRLAIDLDKSTLARIMESLNVFRDENDADVVEDVLRRLKEVSSRADGQLKFLADSFRDLLAFRLQRTNFWLAVIGFALALIGASNATVSLLRYFGYLRP